MAKRIVVFPVKGRRWAFSMSTPSSTDAGTTSTQASFMQVWRLAYKNAMSGKGVVQSFTPLTHYASNKMEQQWIALRAAKEGSFKNRMHSMGEKLLSRIEPSETLLKSMATDATSLEITFPTSLNPRLVRRRLRHIAMSGVQIHSRYMYGSFACFPFSVLFGILPVPNAPLFWNLFRAYANWQALEGSRKLLKFVSDGLDSMQSNVKIVEEDGTPVEVCQRTLVLSPCETLESMLHHQDDQKHVISDSSVARICELYHLDYSQTLKWRDFAEKTKVAT